MRVYGKQFFTGMLLMFLLLFLPAGAGAAEGREVIRLTVRSDVSEATISVLAAESSWGYDFWLDNDSPDLFMEKATAPISVSAEVLDKTLIDPESLEYRRTLQLEDAENSWYTSSIRDMLSFDYRHGDESGGRGFTYAVVPRILNLSIDTLHLGTGTKGFRPSKNNYLPIQVNISAEAYNTLGTLGNQDGKCYLKIQVLNSKGKYVYSKTTQVGSGYLRIHWNGKASKKNSAGVKAGSYVKKGKYKVKATLYYEGAKGNTYAGLVKQAVLTKSLTISSKAPKGSAGLAKGKELPIYTGDEEIDYMAERMLKEAGVKSKDSANTKVRKIYHYMTKKFKHVHYGEKTPKAHFNLSKASTKKAVKDFAAKTKKQYDQHKVLYSYGVAPYYSFYDLREHMVTRSGVCDNQAEIFAILCQHAGINAGVCQGYYLNRNGSKMGHAWNYAVVGGKTWYYDVDVEIQNYGKGQGDYYWYKKSKTQAKKTHKFVRTY